MIFVNSKGQPIVKSANNNYIQDCDHCPCDESSSGSCSCMYSQIHYIGRGIFNIFSDHINTCTLLGHEAKLTATINNDEYAPFLLWYDPEDKNPDYDPDAWIHYLDFLKEYAEGEFDTESFRLWCNLNGYDYTRDDSKEIYISAMIDRYQLNRWIYPDVMEEYEKYLESKDKYNHYYRTYEAVNIGTHLRCDTDWTVSSTFTYENEDDRTVLVLSFWADNQGRKTALDYEDCQYDPDLRWDDRLTQHEVFENLFKMEIMQYTNNRMTARRTRVYQNLTDVPVMIAQGDFQTIRGKEMPWDLESIDLSGNIGKEYKSGIFAHIDDYLQEEVEDPDWIDITAWIGKCRAMSARIYWADVCWNNDDEDDITGTANNFTWTDDCVLSIPWRCNNV